MTTYFITSNKTGVQWLCLQRMLMDPKPSTPRTPKKRGRKRKTVKKEDDECEFEADRTVSNRDEG